MQACRTRFSARYAPTGRGISPGQARSLSRPRAGLPRAAPTSKGARWPPPSCGPSRTRARPRAPRRGAQGCRRLRAAEAAPGQGRQGPAGGAEGRAGRAPRPPSRQGRRRRGQEGLEGEEKTGQGGEAAGGGHWGQKRLGRALAFARLPTPNAFCMCCIGVHKLSKTIVGFMPCMLLA